MWIHRLSGIAILGISLGSGLYIVKETAWEIKWQLHTMMGTIAMIAVGFVAIAGLFVKFLMERLRWKTNILLKLKLGHGVFNIN